MHGRHVRATSRLDDLFPFAHVSLLMTVVSIPSDMLVSFRFSHPYQYELDHLVMPESLKSKPEPKVAVRLICKNSPRGLLIFLPDESETNVFISERRVFPDV